MELENIKPEDKTKGIETLAEPDTFVINTEAEEESLYAKLNMKGTVTTYDAWCHHTD